jgi:hypothetical protein
MQKILEENMPGASTFDRVPERFPTKKGTLEDRPMFLRGEGSPVKRNGPDESWNDHGGSVRVRIDTVLVKSVSIR